MSEQESEYSSSTNMSEHLSGGYQPNRSAAWATARYMFFLGTESDSGVKQHRYIPPQELLQPWGKSLPGRNMFQCKSSEKEMEVSGFSRPGAHLQQLSGWGGKAWTATRRWASSSTIDSLIRAEKTALIVARRSLQHEKAPMSNSLS